MRRDLHGQALHRGDLVIGTNLLDERLRNTCGVVMSETAFEDYIGVQLEEKLLPSSSCPEILYAPSSLWRLQLKGGREA